MHTHLNHIGWTSGERRLARMAPNTAKDFLEKNPEQGDGANANQTPEQRLDTISRSTTDRVKNVWQRGWLSLGFQNETITQSNIKTVIDADAKKLAEQTEQQLGLSQNAMFRKINAIAGKCQTRITLLREKKSLIEKVQADLGKETGTLQKQAESLKSLYGWFSPGNRSGIIKQAEAIAPLINALTALQQETEKEYSVAEQEFKDKLSKSVEGQMYLKAQEDRERFMENIDRLAPQLLGTVEPLLMEYLAGGKSTLEDEINKIPDDKLSPADKKMLIDQLKMMRDGPEGDSKTWDWIKAGMRFGVAGGTFSTVVLTTGLMTAWPLFLTLAGGAAVYAGARGVKKLANRTSLWWNTGHTNEKDLWHTTHAANFATQIRERGDINPPGDALWRKLETLKRGTQISVISADGRTTQLNLGLSRVEPEGTGTPKFARVTLADGRRGAIDLTSPTHDMAILNPGGAFTESKLKIPSIDKKHPNYNANTLYLQAA